MANFAAPAPPMIVARWHGGSQTPRLIVLHSTVSPCRNGAAREVARFFSNRPETGKTSAHYVVDPGEVIQCVPDHTVAYHCGYNQDSLGIELCDMPDAKSKRRWDDKNHRAMEVRAARLVAELCLAYNIRPWFVPAFALKMGVKGVTTHAEMSKAFKRSTHWDPGAWRQVRFMRRVRAEIAAIKRAK
jgi:N-acetylmuramoyl-L-alanine amidase CwlA